MEKEVATHLDISAWKIPWTGELGGYSPGVAESDRTECTRTQARKGLCHLMGWSLKVIIAREPLVQVTY